MGSEEGAVQQWAAPPSVRKKFTGYERDEETGLDFAQARYYANTMGRFMSPDEFGGGPDELFTFAEDASDNPTFYADLTNPQSLNKYQYCYNNPIAFVDPDGHSVWSKVAKLVYKAARKGSGKAALAEEAVDIAQTAISVIEPDVSVGMRIFNYASLVSEFAPVSVKDVKEAIGIVKSIRRHVEKTEHAVEAANKVQKAAELAKDVAKTAEKAADAVKSANKLTSSLDKLAKKAETSTGRKGSQLLQTMAKQAGLTVTPGGNHLNVVNSAGTVITQIPHSLKGSGTARSIAKAIKGTIKYDDN